MATDATFPPLDGPGELFGRDRLLAALERLLAPTARNRVVVLWGEAGCGKTALATTLGSRFDGVVATLDTIGPCPAAAPGPRLVIVDHAPASERWPQLLASLRATDRLLVVSPAPVALGVDESRLIAVEVAALSWDDAVELLAREGVEPAARPGLVRAAEGNPRMLIRGAQAALLDPTWRPELSPCAAQAPSVDLDVAEQAVRDYQCAERLAASPLAVGATEAERAAHVRELVDVAIQAAFGSSYRDANLREVLVAGYVVAAAPHEQLAYELHLSRSTYFRRLATAVGRVAAAVLDADQAASTRVSSRRERILSLS